MDLDALLDAYGDEVDGELHIPARGGVGAGEGVGLVTELLSANKQKRRTSALNSTIRLGENPAHRLVE